MALGRMPELARARAPADGPVTAQHDSCAPGFGCGRWARRRLLWPPPGSLCWGAVGRRSSLRVARLTHRAQVIHLAHRRVTWPTLGQAGTHSADRPASHSARCPAERATVLPRYAAIGVDGGAFLIRFINRRSPSRTPRNTPRASQKRANTTGAATYMTVCMRLTVRRLREVRADAIASHRTSLRAVMIDHSSRKAAASCEHTDAMAHGSDCVPLPGLRLQHRRHRRRSGEGTEGSEHFFGRVSSTAPGPLQAHRLRGSGLRA